MQLSTGRFVHKTLTALAVVLLLLAATGPAASAAEFREGEIVTIGADQIIDDDLYVFGNSIIIDGTVTGDVFSAGGQITIHGNVGGSINAAGGSINVTGRVGKAVRAIGIGSGLQVSGEIGGDLLSLGSDVALADSGVVKGDAILSATNATLDGSIGRNVQGTISNLAIAGPVGGNVDVEVGRLSLKDTAVISGNLTYTSDSSAEITQGSRVGGETTRKESSGMKAGWTQANWWWYLLLLVWAFVLGAVLVLVSPSTMEGVARTVRDRPWGSLAFGALAAFAIPFTVMILGVTIVGLPLAALLLVGYVLAIYLAQVFVGLALGQWIMRTALPSGSRWTLVAALAVGLIVLTILTTALPVPVIGTLVQLITIFSGLGALVLNIRRLGVTARQTPAQ